MRSRELWLGGFAERLYLVMRAVLIALFAVAPTLLLISVVTAIAELVDFGDDNLNVPLCAAALSILLL